MPSLIYQNIKLEDEAQCTIIPSNSDNSGQKKSRQEKKAQENILETYKRSQNKAKSWMWMGVVGISAIIFFFWGWSVVLRITTFNWNKSGEKTLIQNSQEDWNKLFSPSNNNLATNLSLKTQISNLVVKLKRQAELNNASSTTSIVVSATSSTTSSISEATRANTAASVNTTTKINKQ